MYGGNEVEGTTGLDVPAKKENTCQTQNGKGGEVIVWVYHLVGKERWDP